MNRRIDKLLRLRENLGFVGLVRLGVERTLGPWLHPGGQVSYSQFGEDRCIDQLIGWRDRGFYVDVGCNEPRRDSVTYGLYQRGWRGLAIDGNGAFAPLWSRVRPGDRFIEAIVSDSDAPVEFVRFDESRLSSVSGGHVEAWSQRGAAVVARETRVPQTLRSLLEAHLCPDRFELLSVDVEGHDLEVLRSHDFARHRPRLVLAEIHDLFGRGAQDDPVVSLLAVQGYRLVAASMFTAAFLDGDSAG